MSGGGVVVKNSKILEQDLPSKFNIQHGVQRAVDGYYYVPVVSTLGTGITKMGIVDSFEGC
jgi:hypothetical protein